MTLLPKIIISEYLKISALELCIQSLEMASESESSVALEPSQQGKWVTTQGHKCRGHPQDHHSFTGLWLYETILMCMKFSRFS